MTERIKMSDRFYDGATNDAYTEAMKQIAIQALDLAMRSGVSYADVRVVDERSRSLTTKNGKPGSVNSAESLGLGIRVIAGGCWGFAATDDLSKAGMEAAASRAIAIARASALAKKGDVVLAPEDKYEVTWTSPCAIDPFTI